MSSELWAPRHCCGWVQLTFGPVSRPGELKQSSGSIISSGWLQQIHPFDRRLLIIGFGFAFSFTGTRSLEFHNPKCYAAPLALLVPVSIRNSEIFTCKFAYFTDPKQVCLGSGSSWLLVLERRIPRPVFLSQTLVLRLRLLYPSGRFLDLVRVRLGGKSRLTRSPTNHIHI